MEVMVAFMRNSLTEELNEDKACRKLTFLNASRPAALACLRNLSSIFSSR